MILDLRKQLDHLSITELVESVLEKTGYVDILNAQATLESKARVENIEEFLSVTKNFDDTSDVSEEETGLDKLSRFLNDLALIADTDSGSQEDIRSDPDDPACCQRSRVSSCLFDWDGRKCLSS